MTSSALEQFRAAHRRAQTTSPERDPDPVIEALGHLVWLAAVRQPDRLTRKEAKALHHLGCRALVALDSDAKDEDSQATTRTLGAILHAGVQVLDGASLDAVESTTDVTQLHPPAVTMARLIAGRSDGLTAGRYGLHVASCVRCQRELSALHGSERAAGGVAGEPLRLAAAEVAQVRAPGEGRLVARRDAPALEVVVFYDDDVRRVAVYADSTESVRVVAEGVTTEEALSGYWLGRLDPKLSEIDARLRVGGQTLSWRLSVPNAVPAKSQRRTRRAGRNRPSKRGSKR